jgi:glycosyltransferase involved in cell wall biosynthesis
MRIAYVYPQDAADPSVQSGRPAALLDAFRAWGAQIEPVFPLQARPSHLAAAKKIFYRLGSRIHRTDRDPAYLARAAREVEERLRKIPCDLVFSPGSELIGGISCSRRVAFCADATFAGMHGYYHDFTRLSSEYVRMGYAQERSALKRAQLAAYPSEWAARSAIERHGANPSRVVVIPFGANLGRDNSAATVQGWIERRRPLQAARLLFVGRDWRRKGGELVIETAFALRERGLNVWVDVVGCEPPPPHRALSWVITHGRLSVGDASAMRRLRRLYAESHVLFVPSRAEAFGLTYAEAHAHGLPVVATHTGGVPGVVRDHETGRLLPIGAGGGDYAAVILELLRDIDGYRRLCLRCYASFEENHNWRRFADRFLEHLQERGPPHPGGDGG